MTKLPRSSPPPSNLPLPPHEFRGIPGTAYAVRGAPTVHFSPDLGGSLHRGATRPPPDRSRLLVRVRPGHATGVRPDGGITGCWILGGGRQRARIRAGTSGLSGCPTVQGAPLARCRSQQFRHPRCGLPTSSREVRGSTPVAYRHSRGAGSPAEGVSVGGGRDPNARAQVLAQRRRRAHPGTRGYLVDRLGGGLEQVQCVTDGCRPPRAPGDMPASHGTAGEGAHAPQDATGRRGHVEWNIEVPSAQARTVAVASSGRRGPLRSM